MTQIFHEVSAFTPFLFILPVTNKIADLISVILIYADLQTFHFIQKLESCHRCIWKIIPYFRKKKEKLFHTHMEGDFYMNVVLGPWHGWSFPLIHKNIYISCSVKKCRKYLSSDAQALNHSVS